MAQFFVDFGLGYAVPRYKYNEFNMNNNYHNWYRYEYYDFISDTFIHNIHTVKFNPSEGVCFRINMGYRLKHFAFSIETNYLDNRNFANKKTYNSVYSEKEQIHYNDLSDSSGTSNYHSFTERKYFVTWLNFIPRVSYSYDLKNIRFFVTAGVSIDYLTIYEDYSFTGFFCARDIDNRVISISYGNTFAKIKYIPYITYSPVVGGGFAYTLSKHWSLMGEFHYQLKFFTSEKVVLYYEKTTNSIGEVTTSNEEKEIDKDYDPIQLSNYRISLGLRYSFGKKESSAGGGTE